MNWTWRCEICDEERPDAAISVHKVDISKALGLSAGLAQRNIKYCNDRPACLDGAIAKGKEEQRGSK